MDSAGEMLFGTVAIELGILEASQLAVALSACRQPPPQALKAVLLEREWITRDEADAIEQRLQELLAGPHGEHPDIAGEPEESAGDARFQRTILFDASAEAPGLEPTADFKSVSRSKYTLTRVHGKGGLGQVWLAHDRQLRREVALKELVPDKSGSDLAKLRLVKEAQVTGQLEHPNIVPVYDLDEGATGEAPFYTMRFLRGDTLRRDVDRYHDAAKNGRGDRLGLRRLLTAFTNVCHAMAYAHSRGVVHRDLKPSNIVLGNFGEVIVIDWGLATVVGERAEGESSILQVTDIPEDHQTVDGQVIGTPAYMAPEQADGKLHLIDRGTDVYGLGGVLFYILAGQPPHTSAGRGSSMKDTMDMLQRISTQPTPRARSVNSSIPAALDAICAKAMARERGERYATASDLAEDVNRWLADEPVSVHADSWRDRLFRWMRRHRSGTIATAAILLTVALASITAAVIVNEARRDEAAAKTRAEDSLAAEQQALQSERAARVESLRRFQEARRTLDRSVTGVSDVLEFYPGVQTLRAILLRKAADDYERFATEKSDDPELQAESGRAWIRLGDVRRLLNDGKAAETAYRRAIARFEALTKHDPKRPGPRIEAANARGRLALVLAATGRRTEAKAEQKRALDDLTRLSAGKRATAELQLAVASALLNYAELLAGSGERPAAIEKLKSAESKFARLAAGNDDSRYLEGLATARNELAVQLHAAGKHADAVEKLKSAIAGFNVLTLRARDNIDYARRLAGARLNLANAMRVTGRSEANLKVYQDLLKEYVAQYTAQPDLPVHRENIAATRTNVAEVLRGMGRCAQAVEEAAVAIRLYNDLVREHATLARYHFGKAAALHVLGLTLRDLERDGDAEEALKQAVGTFSQLATIDPRNIRFHREHAACLYSLGTLYHRQGKLATAHKQIADSMAASEAALKIDGTDQAGQDGLARSLYGMGELEIDRKQIPTGRAMFQRCRDIRNALQSAPEHVHSLVSLLVYCRDDQHRDPRLAVALVQGLVKSVPDSPRYWSLLGAAQLRAGDARAAVQSLRTAIKMRTAANAFDGFLLAMAQHKLPDAEQARISFLKARKTMLANRPGHPELRRLHDEAAAALGRNAEQTVPKPAVPAPRPNRRRYNQQKP